MLVFPHGNHALRPACFGLASPYGARPDAGFPHEITVYVPAPRLALLKY